VGWALVWIVFWLNTALFPCCEVAAADLGEWGGSALPSVSTVELAHHADGTHSESPASNPGSLCGDNLTAGTPHVALDEVLTPDRLPLEWFTVDASVVTSVTAVTHSARLALVRAALPPSPHFYVRTQRLLI